MSKLEVGNVVALKSGGPNMTIKQIAVHEEYQDHETALCVYFDNNGAYHEGYFELETIEDVDS